MFMGILLLFLGIMILLDRLNIVHGGISEFLLPVAIIALGIDFLVGRSRRSAK